MKRKVNHVPLTNIITVGFLLIILLLNSCGSSKPITDSMAYSVINADNYIKHYNLEAKSYNLTKDLDELESLLKNSLINNFNSGALERLKDETEKIKQSEQQKALVDSLVNSIETKFYNEHDDFLTDTDISQMLSSYHKKGKWDLSKITTQTSFKDMAYRTTLSYPLFNNSKNKAAYIVTTSGFKSLRVFEKKGNLWIFKYSANLEIYD